MEGTAAVRFPPVVGTAKIVSACAKIVRAAALGEEFGVLAEG